MKNTNLSIFSNDDLINELTHRGIITDFIVRPRDVNSTFDYLVSLAEVKETDVLTSADKEEVLKLINTDVVNEVISDIIAEAILEYINNKK